MALGYALVFSNDGHRYRRDNLDLHTLNSHTRATAVAAVCIKLVIPYATATRRQTYAAVSKYAQTNGSQLAGAPAPKTILVARYCMCSGVQRKVPSISHELRVQRKPEELQGQLSARASVRNAMTCILYLQCGRVLVCRRGLFEALGSESQGLSCCDCASWATHANHGL